MEKHDILLFGAFSLNTPRNEVLVNGLKNKSHEIDRINFPRLSGFDRGNPVRDDSVIKFILKLILINAVLLLKGMVQIQKFQKADAVLVLSYGNFTTPSAKLFSYIFTTPLITDSHGSVYFTQIIGRKYLSKKALKSRIYYRLDKMSIYLSNSYLVFSKAMKQQFAETFDCDITDMDVLYTGTLRPQRESIDSIDRGVNIAYWGGFIPFHNTELIVDALSELKSQYCVEPRAALIGSGEMKENCERLVKQENLTNVEFTGYIPESELEEYIESTDVALGVFGKNEYMDLCLTNKVCEAAARGKPILTKQSPAIEELFSHEESVILTSQEHTGDISDKLKMILEDEQLRKKISSESQEVYENNLSPCAVANQFESILSDIC